MWMILAGAGLAFFSHGAAEINVAVGHGRGSLRVPGGAEALGPFLELVDRYEGAVEPLTVPLVAFMLEGWPRNHGPG
jgi:hypothetical protein